MDLLINISSNIFSTIRIVSFAHKLMSVPSKVDVKRRNEERHRRRCHEVKETVSFVNKFTRRHID